MRRNKSRWSIEAARTMAWIKNAGRRVHILRRHRVLCDRVLSGFVEIKNMLCWIRSLSLLFSLCMCGARCDDDTSYTRIWTNCLRDGRHAESGQIFLCFHLDVIHHFFYFSRSLSFVFSALDGFQRNMRKPPVHQKKRKEKKSEKNVEEFIK